MSDRTLRDPTRVSELGTILGVWAHPDDEAYLSGALMALAVEAGNRVVCVTATRGELGTTDPAAWSPARLASERALELERSLAALGVEEHVWLDLPDGGCADVPPDEPEERIAGLIADVRPDTVLTFGPDGMTGHSDHVAVSGWTTTAFRRSGRRGMQLHYATAVPDWLERWRAVADRLKIVMDESLLATTPVDQLSIDLHAEDDVLDRKMEALRRQETQTKVLIDAVGEDAFRTWTADEWFRLAVQT